MTTTDYSLVCPYGAFFFDSFETMMKYSMRYGELEENENAPVSKWNELLLEMFTNAVSTTAQLKR